MTTTDSLANAPTDGDFFRELADGAPVMIWMSGLDMGCFYFNRAWLDFRGRTLEQEFGNGWAEGVHPEDLQRCVSHYVSCFERQIAFAMSYRLQDAAGEYQWILDRGAPHFLPDGTFLGFFGGCADIEDESAVARNAQLGLSLGELRDQARILATEEAKALHALKANPGSTLRTFARDVHESHLARLERKNHAAVEMEQLAVDMLSFSRIARGACLP